MSALNYGILCMKILGIPQNTHNFGDDNNNFFLKILILKLL